MADLFAKLCNLLKSAFSSERQHGSGGGEPPKHQLSTRSEPQEGESACASAQPAPSCAQPGDLVNVHLHICEQPTAMEMLLQVEALGEPDRVLVSLDICSGQQRANAMSGALAAAPMLKTRIDMVKGQPRVHIQVL